MTAKLEPRITPLQIGEVSLPLEGAHSFWVNNKKNHEITVYYNTGSHQTAVRLFLGSAAAMHQCISYFLNNTNMWPNILTFRDVKPIVSEVSEPGKPSASIHFEFNTQEDMDFFLRHYSPYISEYTSTLGCRHGMECGTKYGNVMHDYVTVTTYNETDTKEEKIEKINKLFGEIKVLFGDSGISDALQRNQDPKFPGNALDGINFTIDHQGIQTRVQQEESSFFVPVTEDELKKRLT